MYKGKYTGAEVDALLDKIADDDVIDIDSSLSTTSTNPVMNKIVTGELNKKADKSYVDTKLSEIGGGQGGGGNFSVEGFIPLSRDFSDDFNNDFTR